MNIKFVQFENKTLNILDHDLAINDWQKKPTWISITSNNREEVFGYFKENNIFLDAEQEITDPKNNINVIKLQQGVTDNLIISNAENIYAQD